MRALEGDHRTTRDRTELAVEGAGRLSVRLEPGLQRAHLVAHVSPAQRGQARLARRGGRRALQRLQGLRPDAAVHRQAARTLEGPHGGLGLGAEVPVEAVGVEACGGKQSLGLERCGATAALGEHPGLGRRGAGRLGTQGAPGLWPDAPVDDETA